MLPPLSYPNPGTGRSHHLLNIVECHRRSDFLANIKLRIDVQLAPSTSLSPLPDTG
jgi:hypothetical protein